MADLLQWWNLVYVLAFFFALLYALLNAVGLASSSAADADADVDVDVDADLDVDLDADIDADVDVDVDLDADVDVDADLDADVEVGADVDHDFDAADAYVEPGMLEEALSFFGIGRVPLSVILMSFLMTFAVVGWAVNTVLGEMGFPWQVFFPISCTSAVVCSLAGTKVLAGLLGRYLKPVESSAVRRSALVGSIATAKLPITAKFGTALVRDSYGTLHKVVCKVSEGAETIPRGKSVLLVRYVRRRTARARGGGHYLVEPYDVPDK